MMLSVSHLLACTSLRTEVKYKGHASTSPVFLLPDVEHHGITLSPLP
jgi:hypothetical protein